MEKDNRKKEIVKLATKLKNYYQTSDPFVLAEHLGIEVIKNSSAVKDFKAQIIKVNGYPIIISINDGYTELSQKVLCAHELGHALLHDGCNTFGTTVSNVNSDVELEANLFAVALLFHQWEINVKFEKMDNYLLKSMLDLNIQKK